VISKWLYQLNSSKNSKIYKERAHLIYKMTIDLYIGFEKEPEGLADFLFKEGYTQFDRHTEGCVVYSREDDHWPQLFYYPLSTKVKEREVPNWEKAGFKVVSELNINFPKEMNAMDEAERLSEEIVRRLDGILYDDELDEYFTKEDI